MLNPKARKATRTTALEKSCELIQVTFHSSTRIKASTRRFLCQSLVPFFFFFCFSVLKFCLAVAYISAKTGLIILPALRFLLGTFRCPFIFLSSLKKINNDLQVRERAKESGQQASELVGVRLRLQEEKEMSG